MSAYYFTYKTTNIQNGNYYFGKHETNNLNDGYIGSGKYLIKSINEYGKENHKTEIINFYDSREKLIEAEIVLINNLWESDEKCLNAAPGGQGGTLFKWTAEQRKKLSEKLKNRKNDWGHKVSKALKGKRLSDEQYERAAKNRIGEKNGSWIECDESLICELYNSGLGVRTIARKLGLGRKVIYNRLKKHKLI